MENKIKVPVTGATGATGYFASHVISILLS